MAAIATFVAKRIKCASPTCTRSVVVNVAPPAAVVDQVLRRVGWVKQQQEGDDRALNYCGRCAQ